MVLTRADLFGHTFRCTTGWQKDRTSINILSGESGYITDVSPDLSQVHIMICSRPTNARAQYVPVANLEIGPLYIAGSQPLPIVLHGPITTSIRNHPAGETTYRNDVDPFRKGVASFLSSVWTNRGRIPHLNRQHRSLIDDAAIRSTTQKFRNNIAHINPQFFATISNRDCTLDDFTRILKLIDNNDHDAGIYLIIVDQFKKGTARFGLLSHAYVGQSNDIGKRLNQHVAKADSSDLGQEIHQAMRDGARRRVFKLASHEIDEGGSDQAGKAMRDVMETTFMMIFNTMSARVMAPVLRDTSMLGPDVARDYDAQEMAKLFTDLARDAFDKAGFSLPSPSRRTPFGLHRYGCNYTIPLGGETADAYDRVLWCRQTVGDRWTFHRSPFKLRGDRHVLSMNYRTSSSSGLSLIIQPTAKELKDMGIKTGDEIHPIWEVQRPGKGQHPVPFFRICEIGPWENWHYANKVAFKLMWRTRSGKWKTKYFQRDARPRFVPDTVAQGALLDYSLGVGVYCFFIRARFPEAQNWSADFGQAKLVAASIDNFNQQVIITHVATAAERLNGPTFNSNICRLRMQRLGLSSVNGPWESFNWDWKFDRDFWKDGKVAPKTETRSFNNRHKCDFCYLAERSELAGMHKLTMKCDRVGNSNICVPCAKMGRPCSWTSPPLLFGINDWHDEIYKARTTKGDLHKAFVKGLMCWPKTEEALQVHDIGLDSGVVLLGDETTQHAPVAWSKLTANEREAFNRWDNQLRTAIDAVLQQRLGTTEYYAAMEVVTTLAENVNTDGRLSPTLRSYMKRIVERDVYFFMVNGRPYQRSA